MKELYNYLKVELGMNSPDTVLNKVQEYKNSEIENLISYIFRSIKIINVDNTTIFNFKANNSFAGSGYPCNHIACRMKKLEELMRFSALYADYVYIDSPFDKYMHQLENIEGIDRYSLGIDIIILLELEPLVLAEIVKFQSDYICLCSECSKKFGKHLDFFDANVNYDEILEECISTISCRLLNKQNPEIHITNGEKYGFDHEMVVTFKDFIPDNIAKLLKVTKSNSIRLEKNDVIEAGIPSMILENVYEDVLMNYIYSRESKISYLTDRVIDFSLLNMLNDDKENKLELLNHTLSIIPNIGINKVVDLRLKDGESFKVYRDTLNEELRKLKNPTDSEIIDFQQDIIQPNLNKINLTLNNYNKRLMREIKRDVFLWGGVLSVGMISGVLNNNFSNILNTIGGVGTIYNVYDKVDKLHQNYSVNNEPFYFLWKLNNV